jgi:hypothetical protein
MSRAPLLLAGLLALTASCDRRKGPQGDMKQAVDWGSGEDSSSGIADPHAGMDMGSGDDQPDPHAGLDMGSGGGGPDNPHGEMGGGPPHAMDPNQYLEGTIELGDPSMKVPAGATMFVFAEGLGADGNPVMPPVAAAIGNVPDKFPAPFRLDDSNVMSMGANSDLSGKLGVKVWVNQAHDASTHTPGDLEGMLIATVPAKDLVLKLDKVDP